MPQTSMTTEVWISPTPFGFSIISLQEGRRRRSLSPDPARILRATTSTAERNAVLSLETLSDRINRAKSPTFKAFTFRASLYFPGLCRYNPSLNVRSRSIAQPLHRLLAGCPAGRGGFQGVKLMRLSLIFNPHKQHIRSETFIATCREKQKNG